MRVCFMHLLHKVFCKMDAARIIASIYTPGFAFPSWVSHPTVWKSHDFSSTKVFYNSKESTDDVKKLLMQREPTNISLRRNYSKDLLAEHFGYSIGAYSLSTSEKLMPNIAIYTHATIKLSKGFTKVHVINLIGAAFDNPSQPDAIYFRDRPIDAIIDFYRNMWTLAATALFTSPCKKLQIYNVGGGAFAGTYSPTFIMNIFEPAMKPLLPLFAKHGREIIGYDWVSHKFTAGYIPDCLESADLTNTMFVNAWDPWSLIGNGNERDNSLDGYWGRISNMAILGWMQTNPSLKFCPVY